MEKQTAMQEAIKEKAKEYVDKFTYSCRECDYQDKAKQCALIAVDDKYSAIINVIVDLKGRGSIDHNTFLKALTDINTEWLDCKQEIENL